MKIGHRKDHPWLCAAVRKDQEQHTDATDGRHEGTLGKTNGTAGNNRDGEKEQ